MSGDASTLHARTPVVAAALELFLRQGFDQTSVEQIAHAAGVSRSTFFRQFGGKEGVVFADHELLLDDLREWLGEYRGDPWLGAIEASIRVFSHFEQDPELAQRRYLVVRQVQALRDREIVMAARYEKLFTQHLRQALPGIEASDAVGFAGLVTAVHNHALRLLVRGRPITQDDLRGWLERALQRYGVWGEVDARPDDVVVAVFPRRMPVAEVTKRLRQQLD